MLWHTDRQCNAIEQRVGCGWAERGRVARGSGREVFHGPCTSGITVVLCDQVDCRRALFAKCLGLDGLEHDDTVAPGVRSELLRHLSARYQHQGRDEKLQATVTPIPCPSAHHLAPPLHPLDPTCPKARKGGCCACWASTTSSSQRYVASAMGGKNTWPHESDLCLHVRMFVRAHLCASACSSCLHICLPVKILVG